MKRLQYSNGVIIYHSNTNKIHPGFKGNFRIFDPLSFIAELTQHIPLRRRAQVIYYGRYSSASRGKRKRDEGNSDPRVVVASSTVPRSIRRAWARLIAKVYQVNPLICPRCGGKMKITEFIFDPEEIEEIMLQQGIELHPHNKSPAREPRDIVYELYQDSIPSDEEYCQD